jgi:hypothetical protein
MTKGIQAAHAEDDQCATPPLASGGYSWVVVLLLWAVCFFSYADRQAFFSVFPLLQKEMTLTVQTCRFSDGMRIPLETEHTKRIHWEHHDSRVASYGCNERGREPRNCWVPHP